MTHTQKHMKIPDTESQCISNREMVKRLWQFGKVSGRNVSRIEYRLSRRDSCGGFNRNSPELVMPQTIMEFHNSKMIGNIRTLGSIFAVPNKKEEKVFFSKKLLCFEN